MPDILVFEVSDTRYGVDAAVVQEVVRAVAIVGLPGAPAIVEGVFNLRGALVPLLDLRSRFGHAPRAIQLADRFIVVRAGSRVVALHADATEDLARVDRGVFADVLRVIPQSKWIAGTAALPDGLVLIHDVETFLDAPESDALDHALDRASVPA